MFNGEIDTETFFRDLELLRSVTVGEESETHEEIDDSLLGELLESSEVHSLRIYEIDECQFRPFVLSWDWKVAAQSRNQFPK